MNQKTQSALSVAFSILGSIGVAATGIAVAKETPAVNKKLKLANNKKEKVKTYISGYRWSGVIGVATICSITAGTIFSKKVEASLSATTIMLDQAYRKYKYKVEELLGDRAKDITSELAKDDYSAKKNKLASLGGNSDGTQLYWEEHIGFFRAKPESLGYAIADTNERLQSPDSITQMNTTFYANLRSFLYDANAKVLNKNVDDISFDYGWTSDYLSEVYQERWVHMYTEDVTADDGTTYKKVWFDKEPIADICEEAREEYYGYSRSLFSDEDYDDETNLSNEDEGFERDYIGEAVGDDNLRQFLPNDPQKRQQLVNEKKGE